MENYQAQVGKWQEVSEARYMEMLEILPPIFYAGGFFMQEPLHADLHDFFIEKSDKFYTAVFSEKATAKEIKESLVAFVNKKECTIENAVAYCF